MVRILVTCLVVIFLGACDSKPSLEIPSTNKVQFAEKPKNIILLIGDGMGLTQVSTAIYSKTQKTNFERFPVIGFQKTHAKDNLVTDSAAGATAMACGIKTYRNGVGVNHDTIPQQSILELAESKGYATGLVSTVTIVHATPAAFIAHQKYRNLYEQIAEDFLDTEIDLFIGGGKRYFDRRNIDERNLIKELEAKNYVVKNYFNNNLSSKIMNPEKNFAFFTADNHPLSKTQGRDYLPKAAKLSVDFLKKRSKKGFFLMLEGSQIDWAGHSNEPMQLIDELSDFNETIGVILEFALRDKETLVIVTGDHETGGLAINDGSKFKRLKLGFTSNDHTATMIPVFAIGPQAELFRGIYENTAIHEKMKIALDLE
jgi:alkaline phosphatase